MRLSNLGWTEILVILVLIGLPILLAIGLRMRRKRHP